MFSSFRNFPIRRFVAQARKERSWIRVVRGVAPPELRSILSGNLLKSRTKTKGPWLTNRTIGLPAFVIREEITDFELFNVFQEAASFTNDCISRWTCNSNGQVIPPKTIPYRGGIVILEVPATKIRYSMKHLENEVSIAHYMSDFGWIDPQVNPLQVFPTTIPPRTRVVDISAVDDFFVHGYGYALSALSPSDTLGWVSAIVKKSKKELLETPFVPEHLLWPEDRWNIADRSFE